MKKILFLFACVLLTGQLAGQTGPDSVTRTNGQYLIPDEAVDSLLSMVNHSRLTAVHTEPEIMFNQHTDYIWLWIAAVVSALIGVLGFFPTFFTWTGINGQKISKKFHQKIFMDLIRHLYRNKVVVCAMGWKLADKGYDKYYPSEEHLLKLKQLPEDLRLDRFRSAPKHYDKLHKLELLFRNYDTEVDVALEHLKTQTISQEFKIRDIHYTLEFKSQMLTKEIRDLLIDLKLVKRAEWKKKDENEKNDFETFKNDTTEKDRKYDPINFFIRQSLLKEIGQKKKNRTVAHDPKNVPVREHVDGNDRYRYYDDDLQLENELSEDISNEYDKIQLIPFPRVSPKPRTPKKKPHE